jgi:hypothetical protein
MRVNAPTPRDAATSVLASHESEPHADGIVTSRRGERA